MYLPLSVGRVHLQFFGILSVFFFFFSNLDRTLCKQANGGYPDQMPQSAVYDLGLHCLPMYHQRRT